MAVLSDYTSGTITLANGSTAVTGTGTLFDVAKFREGDTLQIQNLTAVIASVNGNTSLTLTAPWTGTSLTDAPYRARYLPDGARVTAQATTLIELLGNGVLSNLAEIGVEDGKVPVGNAAGEYELKDQSSLGMKDPNGSLGKLAALTLAADKILNTDASGNLTQSDITAAALVLLKLAGSAAADTLPFFNGADSSALTPLTAFARSILDDANAAAVRATIGAQATLGFTPINKAGDTGVGTLAMTGSLDLNNAFNGWHLRIRSFGDHESGFWNDAGGMDMSVRNYQAANRSVIKPVGLSEIGGDLIVQGAFSAASKNFRMDHFLDPKNKDLVHASFEGPENGLIYRGTAQMDDGRASINIDTHFGMTPGTFAGLNAEVTVFLQVQYGPGNVWLEAPVDNGEFTIVGTGVASEAIVAWMVVARRDDPFIRSDLCKETDANGRLIVEPEKED